MNYDTFAASDFQVLVRNADGSVRSMTYFWQSWKQGRDSPLPEAPECYLKFAAVAWDA